MKTILLAVTAFGLIAGATPSFAAPCKDMHGHFIKCPPPPARKMAAKAVGCRDGHGHFIKCPPRPAASKVCRNAKGHFQKC